MPDKRESVQDAIRKKTDELHELESRLEMEMFGKTGDERNNELLHQGPCFKYSTMLTRSDTRMRMETLFYLMRTGQRMSELGSDGTFKNAKELGKEFDETFTYPDDPRLIKPEAVAAHNKKTGKVIAEMYQFLYDRNVFNPVCDYSKDANILDNFKDTIMFLGLIDVGQFPMEKHPGSEQGYKEVLKKDYKEDQLNSREIYLKAMQINLQKRIRFLQNPKREAERNLDPAETARMHPILVEQALVKQQLHESYEELRQQKPAQDGSFTYPEQSAEDNMKLGAVPARKASISTFSKNSEVNRAAWNLLRDNAYDAGYHPILKAVNDPDTRNILSDGAMAGIYSKLPPVVKNEEIHLVENFSYQTVDALQNQKADPAIEKQYQESIGKLFDQNSVSRKMMEQAGMKPENLIFINGISLAEMNRGDRSPEEMHAMVLRNLINGVNQVSVAGLSENPISHQPVISDIHNLDANLHCFDADEKRAKHNVFRRMFDWGPFKIKTSADEADKTRNTSVHMDYTNMIKGCVSARLPQAGSNTADKKQMNFRELSKTGELHQERKFRLTSDDAQPRKEAAQVSAPAEYKKKAMS